MTSVESLLSRMTTEHSDMPLDAIRRAVSRDNVRACLTAVTPSTTEVVQSLQTANIDSAANWLGGLSEKEQYTVLHKLKVIATTAKLMDMMPKQFRDQIEKVVNTVTAPTETPPASKHPPAQLQAQPSPSPSQAQPTNAGTAAMNMINQMMNSGVMQQMQEMGEAADDDMDQMKHDVAELKQEVEQLKRVMKAIMSKLEKLKESKSTDSRRLPKKANSMK